MFPPCFAAIQASVDIHVDLWRFVLPQSGLSPAARAAAWAPLPQDRGWAGRSRRRAEAAGRERGGPISDEEDGEQEDEDEEDEGD